MSQTVNTVQPLKAVRGTRDLLPPETELWNRIDATARRVFARYNFGEIRTPIFEDTALFARGVGEETDIVSKEMYTWEDKARFDREALHDVWWQGVEGKFQGDRVSIKSRAHQVFQRPDGSFQLVSFQDSATSGNFRDLWHIVREFRQEQGLGIKDVVGTLVFPEESPLENIPPEFCDGTIDGWPPIRGNFFPSRQRLTLRPENTAGVVRAYIEHKLGEQGLLQKLYYIGPQFRRERPQKGRYRQFFQIGAEVIGPPSAGSESPLRDAEVLEMLAAFLNELGIVGWRLLINSVGTPADRPRYVATLREALQPVVGQMCADCQRRAETNPLRVLDCKHPEDQPIIATLPRIWDSLDDASRAHFQQVCEALDACGVPYEHDHRLVRGLDYYTRTTFEFQHGGLGAQNALLGGGRYDGLSEAIGGPRAPGIGFAIGEDRLVLTLQAQAEAENAKRVSAIADAYIAPIGEAQNALALSLAHELRAAGLRIELGDGSFRLKKSFEAADKLARKIVILGEDEANSRILAVKDFATGEQTKAPWSDLGEHLK